MKNIIIFGASGHAKVIIDIIEKENKYQIVGIIDNELNKGSVLLGYQVIGKDDDVPELIAKYSVVGAIIAIGDNYRRYRLANSIKEQSPHLSFISIQHPAAIIAKDVDIAEGCVIMAGTIIGPSCSIREGCILNTRSSLDHDSSMGAYSSLAPNVTTGGEVSIGALTAVGIGATISHGISIGERVVIGAGSTVLSDLPSFQTAYGSPAKVIRPRKADEPYL